MKVTKCAKILLSLILAVLMMGSCICLPVTAEATATADSTNVSWNLMSTGSGYTLSYTDGWTKSTDGVGVPYYNSKTDSVSLTATDSNNVLIAQEMFSIEGDFKISSYPSGTRDGELASGKPLSLICWITQNKATTTNVFNALRLDNEGYLHTAADGTQRTDIRLPLNEWVTIKCVLQPARGLAELVINGERVQKFTFTKATSDQYRSVNVRFFDGYFDWDAQMRNLSVKSVFDYVIGEEKEPTSNYIACQTTKVTDGRFDLRMISGLDSLQYANAGYTVYKLSEESGVMDITEQVVSSQKIYRSLNTVDASGNIVSVPASDYGVNYFSAIVLEGLTVPTVRDELYIIRPWMEKDGLRIYGDYERVLVSPGVSEDGNPKLTRQTEATRHEVIASDDTYIGGKYQDYGVAGPHGDDAMLNIKYDPDASSSYNRKAYVKFTLDEATRGLIEKAITVKLELVGYDYSLSEAEEARGYSRAKVTGVGTTWTEDDLLTSTVSSTAAVKQEIGDIHYTPNATASIDVTDYVKNYMSGGAVAFSFEHDEKDKSQERPFYSKEYADGLYAPKLVLVMSNLEMSYELDLVKVGNKGAEPWGYAEKLVSEWFAEGGDYDRLYAETYTPKKLSRPDNDSGTGEYSVYNPMKSVSSKTDEDDGKTYVDFVDYIENSSGKHYNYVRTLDTLSGYTKATDSTATRYDMYGGITNLGITGESTGFFHTEVIGGKTYIIDPIGNPFFVLGVNTINAGTTANQTAAVKKKYNGAENYKEKFYKDLKKELKSKFGLNTAVGTTVEASNIFSNAEDGTNTGLAFVASFSGITGYMGSLGLSVSLGGSSAFYYNDTMNVFDPDFVTYVDTNAKKTADARRDNPWLLGYTCDNEIPGGEDMLTRYLTIDSSDPVNAFSYATAWTWLKAKTKEVCPTLSDVTDEMQIEFMAFVYNRYFKTTSTAIKTYDPNHLYLGSRSHTPTYGNEGYLRPMAEYVDVMTVNLYGAQRYASINSYIEIIQTYSDKPFIVSEFGVRALDAVDINGKKLGNYTGTACWLVETQKNRANSYESYVLNLLESGSCLGWVLYRFQDNDQTLYKDESGNIYSLASAINASVPKYVDVATGEIVSSTDISVTLAHQGETDSSNLNHNKGIYDNNMNPYEIMAASMKRISDNMVNLINHFH